MSIIGVRGVPVSWPINQLQIKLSERLHNMPFEALNYEIPKGNVRIKNAYLQLSETLDPWVVIEEINKKCKFKGGIQIRAFMPEKVPDMPLPISHVKKVLAATAPPQPPEKVIYVTHIELLAELQYKYTLLQQLNAKTGNKLLKAISETLFERLKHVMETNQDNVKTPFIMSKAYRKMYPHFADFQLVLSTLHLIQDAAQEPRSQIEEKELMKVGPEVDDIPVDRVKQICAKYAAKIEQKVLEHIDELKCEPRSNNPDELARCRIRSEFKHLRPHIAQMVKQVVNADFIQTTNPTGTRNSSKYIRMRVYGEPFLPTRDYMETITRPIDAKRFIRSDNIFNMLAFTTNLRHYRMLMQHNDKELGGAKLLIRKAEMKTYKPSQQEYNQMLGRLFNNPNTSMPVYHDETEDWGEEL